MVRTTLKLIMFPQIFFHSTIVINLFWLFQWICEKYFPSITGGIGCFWHRFSHHQYDRQFQKAFQISPTLRIWLGFFYERGLSHMTQIMSSKSSWDNNLYFVNFWQNLLSKMVFCYQTCSDLLWKKKIWRSR